MTDVRDAEAVARALYEAYQTRSAGGEPPYDVEWQMLPEPFKGLAIEVCRTAMFHDLVAPGRSLRRGTGAR